jgi:hypothetical protein
VAFLWLDNTNHETLARVARLIAEIGTRNLTNGSNSANQYTMMLDVKDGKYKAFLCADLSGHAV